MTVEIYTKDYCPFCHRAKSLLEQALLDTRGVTYTEYDVTRDAAGQAEMRARSGGFTVPQIFIDGTPIGGSDDLVALAQTGELDTLLGRSAAAAV